MLKASPGLKCNNTEKKVELFGKKKKKCLQTYLSSIKTFFAIAIYKTAFSYVNRCLNLSAPSRFSPEEKFFGLMVERVLPNWFKVNYHNR